MVDHPPSAPFLPKSSDELWKEMSPETCELSRAIIGNNSALHTINNDHFNDLKHTDDNPSSTGKIHPRVAIGRAITLMESKHPVKKQQGDLLLTYLLSVSSLDDSSTTESTANPTSLPFPTRTLRVGLAGPPGAGKSTLVEAFGTKLLEDHPDLKLAVVCIDPSSTRSGGSILGDKTRMTELSRHPRALVRPSCNAGVLGGLNAYTDDVVRLLGCAEYPLVLVETVGLGQSEIEVAQSVDVLVLLVPPSGGDDLQGVKKGIVEMANVLAVTKDDGDLQAAADRTAADYKSAVRVLYQSSQDTQSQFGSGGSDCRENGDNHQRWMPPVIKTSSITKGGLDDLWETILGYQNHLLETGAWENQRQRQSKYWMWKQFGRMIQAKMKQDPGLREKAHQLEKQMLQGLLTPRVAAQLLQDELFAFAK